ncbi:MAG: hypothetical protein QM666_11550, partial [Acinetobacter sp.]
LDDLNISLDSLDAEQFQQLTAKKLQPVLDGIAAAQQAGLSIKINTVLMRGSNDDQIVPLTRWAEQRGIPLRFIEYMPLDGDGQWQQQQVVTEQHILQVLAQQYAITPIQQMHEPARYYQLSALHHQGNAGNSEQDQHAASHQNTFKIGIISTISHAFCGECDRIRITAQGELFNCLFAEQGLPLKNLLEQWYVMKTPALKAQIIHKIQQYIWYKAEGYHTIQQQKQFQTNTQTHVRKISMHMLGG